MSDTANEFLAILKDALDETGLELEESLEDVAQYASERADHLATIVDDPGFLQAVRAERDNVALKAGLEIADDMDAIDRQILGLIQGALAFAAKLLAA